MKNKKFAGLIALVMLFVCSVVSAALGASTGISPGLFNLNADSYAKVFTLTSGRYTGLYKDANFTQRISSTAWTGEDDEIWLIGVGRNNNGTAYARIKYPAGSRIEAYMNLKETFVPGSLINNAKRAKNSFYGLARRKGGSRFSSYGIDAGDSVYLLTKEDGWCQVLYPVGSLWRIAWLTQSEYNSLFVEPIPGDDEDARNKVVSYAYEILDYEWETPANQYVLLYYNAYNPSASNGLKFDVNPVVATGRVRGIPYTLGYGNISETPFAQYKALSAYDKVKIGNIYSYSGSRVSMQYGMSCATFVTDCIRQGLNAGLGTWPNTGIENASGWSNYVTKRSTNNDSDYRELQKGDYLYSYGHVLLVVENNGSSIKALEQTPPDYTRINCSNKKTVTASLTYNGVTRSYTATQVCMQCAACKKGTLGTQETTYSYSTLRKQGYYPRFIKYPKDTSVPNPPEITDVPMAIVVAGSYYSYQCKTNGTVTSWTASSLPEGLSINETTGLISGTLAHTAYGKSAYSRTIYRVNLTASNAGGTSTKQGYIYVCEPPVITTSSSLQDGTINNSYNATIKAEGTEYSMRWEGIGLPPGLNLAWSRSKRTATISGTPTQGGTYKFTVKCYNLVGNPETTATKEFTIKVNGSNIVEDPTLKAVWGYFVTGAVGKNYSDFDRFKSSYDGVLSISGNRPDGLSFRRSGQYVYLEGTPTKAGTYTFKLTPHKTSGGYYDNTYTVKINPGSSPLNILYTLKNGKRGVYYNDYVKTTGGSAPYTPSVISGRLPHGLQLVQSGASTYLRGTPTQNNETQTFTLKVTDSNGSSVTKTLTVKINTNSSYRSGAPKDGSAVKPSISSKTLPTAAVDNEWSATLEAYGTQPITWSAEGLPEWLYLDENSGKISGIPTEVGKYRFKVKAENAVGSKTKNLKIKVIAEKPSIETRTLPNGVLKAPYEVQLKASGSEPLKWKKIGKLPSGLKLNKKTARIEGTPTKAGTYNFSLKVKNKAGYDTVQYSIVIKEQEDEKPEAATTAALSETMTAANLDSSPKDEQLDADDEDVYTELFILKNDEKFNGVVNCAAGEAVNFVIGEWVDSEGRKVKVSDIKIFVNDKLADKIEISDDGTFTIPQDLVSGDFNVYATAQYGGQELNTSEIFVSTAENENSSEKSGSSGAGCSTGAGIAGVFFGLLAFLKKTKK